VRRGPITRDFWPLDFYQNPELLSIAILMDFHHDRIEDTLERVIIYSRVSINSYNINAQAFKVNTIIKVKILIGWYAPMLAFA
jgi:hypothetical protein